MNHLNLALREHFPLICVRHLPVAKEAVNRIWLPKSTEIPQVTQNAYLSCKDGWPHVPNWFVLFCDVDSL